MMRRARRAVLASIWIMAAACVLALPATALEMRSRITGGGVELTVPGTYWEVTVERGASPEGPFAFIGYRYIGCTEACEYLDFDVEEGATYYYRSILLGQAGNRLVTDVHGVSVPFMMDVAVSPNPSAAEATIRFRVPARAARGGDADCAVDVIDVTGRGIARVFAGPLGRGVHAVTWDGRDDRGERVKAGAYFYVVRVGDFVETGRMHRIR